MSCTYEINGENYSQSQLESIISGNLSLASIKTETGEQAAERLKQETSDRFVNADLFTDYQEKAYTRQITAEVINNLNILTPGQEIAKTPAQAFKEVKDIFQNGKDELQYLQSVINTQEKLDNYKGKPEVLAKFKVLSIINNVDQFGDIINQYENVLSHWDKFLDQVKVQIRSYGITIKGDVVVRESEDDKVDQLRDLANTDNEDLVELSDREISESFEDGRSFQMNPRDTASTRVKVFAYNIPDVTRNAFGIREFADPDMVLEDLLRTGSELEVINYESLIKALQSKYTYRPYLKNLVAKLAQIKADNNNQLINEILTFVNKAYQEHITNLWNDKDGGISVKIVKSNRNSVVKQITRDWLEQQKNSDITVRTDNGELMINTQKVKELSDSFDIIRGKSGTVEAKKAWISTFMNAIGIKDFSDSMIDDLVLRAGDKFFQKEQRNNSFEKMFEDNNFFSNVLKTYAKIPSGSTDSKYDDVNNGMKDESFAFNKLAQIYHDHNPTKYQTGNSQNSEGKSIYAYIQKSYLENLKKKISSNVLYLDKILGRSFSRTSEVAQKLKNNLTSGVKDFLFEFDYMDGLRKDTRGKDGVVRKNMSTKEQLFDTIQKHQNEGQRIGYYNLFTLSDKTQTPTISTQKYIINDSKQNRAGKDLTFTTNPGATFIDSFNLKQEFKDQLFRLAESEINRITDYVNHPDPTSIDIKNFDKAYQFFYLFPILNSSANAELNTVKEKLFTRGEILNEGDKSIIKEVLANSFKNTIETTFHKWIANDIIVPKYNEDNGQIVDLTFPLFNAAYTATKEMSGLTSFQKAIYAIADLKFNHLRAQVNALQLLGADPANFYKFPKAGADRSKAFADYTDTEKLNIVLSTMDEFSKRAAMFIAPGSQGVWSWNDKSGNIINKQSFNTITLKDFKRDTELFDGVDVTDAQEFITLQEHIDRLMAEGKITDELWNSITDKITKANGAYFNLSPKELKLVVQPTKPVYTNNTDISSFPRIDYIKSSTYVMIPEIVAGSELDKMRRWMEAEDIQSAHFESTKKTGQANQAASVFDTEGNFTTPSKFTIQALDREGLHTQQEIPYQKDHITNVSQMNRTLFDGLLKVKNFDLPALPEKDFTGKQFKDLKENVRIAQFEKAKEKTIKRLGITVTPSGYAIDNQRLVDMLREEALKPSSGFSINDINAIKLDETGEFAMPIYLMPRGEKFEGLLNSIINKNVMLKNPGTSLVQVSSIGTNKMNFSELSNSVKSEILWTQNFDPKKGLQYLRKSKGEVLPAQIIMSQFIKDKSGNLIDLSEFMYEDDGLKFLDLDKIPVSVLQLVGSRIPNQSHPSMLPIEVVGFLPNYMESTIIVPDGITAQMGSDFDVDKLYAYTNNLEFNYNKNKELTSVKTLDYDITNYDDTHTSLSSLSDEQLEQLYRDIHWSVLTHPSTFEKIVKSIDFNDVKDEVSLLDSIGLYSTDLNIIPFDFENQMQVFNDNKGGKVGVGIFASLGSFLADNQDKDIMLGNVINDNGRNVVVINPISVLSKDGRVLELYKVTQQGQVGKGSAQRTKGDNNNIAMSEAVDNAKNKNMYRFNWHPKVLNAVAAFISLSTEKGEIHDMTFATRLFPQQILQEYVNLIENAQDSLSTFQGDIKDIINKKLTSNYYNNLSTQGKANYDILLDNAAKDPNVVLHEIFSAERLLDLLKTSVRIKRNDPSLSTDILDDYYKAQLDILSLYNRLDEVGSELSTVIGASYIYTKGIGRNIFSVTDNIRKLSKLADSEVFVGLEEIAGKVTVEGTRVTLEPKGEIGHSINNSLFFARDLYRSAFPVHFHPWFIKTVDIILTNAGIDKQKVGSEKYIKLHKKIFQGLRSFMFSDPSLEIFDNISEERNRLLMDTVDNKSLATRITEARVNHPELLENYFVKRLAVQVSSKQGDPSIVRYSNSFSADIDELANNRGFLSLVFSKNDELQNIAKDLLRYTYVTGNNETSGGFAKFIPIEYTLSDPDFLKGLKSLEGTLANNGSKFIRQFIQNDPGMAKVLNDEQFEEITKGTSSRESISIPQDSVAYEKLLVNTTYEERQAFKEFKKLPDYLTFNDFKNNQTLLYVKIGDVTSIQFRRINTLGTPKSGFVEFSSKDENLTSIIFNNLTNAQKLDKVLTNPNNVFNGSDINLISRIREVAMSDVSTKFIGMKVPGGTDTKSYIDITADVWKKSGRNNSNYTSDDTVMIIGTNGYTLKPNKEYISASEIQDHFNNIYKPLIDKAITAGASFTVGKFSGIDDLVNKYLRSNGYWETNTGLGYSKYTPREENYNINLDEMPDYDIDTLDISNMVEPNYDDLDLDAMSLEELPTPQRTEITETTVMEDPSEFPADINITQEPFEDIYDLVDPNDLLNMDKSEDEIDLEVLSNPQDTTGTSIVSMVDSIKGDIVSTLVPNKNGSDKVEVVLNNIYNSTNNPFYKNLIDIFRTRKGGIPNVDVFIDDTIENPGIFSNNTIYINPALALNDDNTLSPQRNFENVLMHEITHAYTASVINDYTDNKSNLTDKELIFTKSLDNLFKDTRDMLFNDEVHGPRLAQVLATLSNDPENATLSSKDKSMYYGLTSIHEFTSMLLTDPGFQQFMNTLHYDSKKNISIFEQFKELLSKLLDALAKTLGIDVKEKSVLTQGVNDIVSMIKSSELQDLSSAAPDNLINDTSFDLENIITDPKELNQFDPYKINTPKGIFDANDDQRIAIDKVGEFFSKPVTSNFEDNIFLVYGAGGTGKTAVAANAINKALKENKKGVNVGFAAVTHTAKGELRSAGNEEAKTLASMLGALPVFEDGVETFKLVPYDTYLEEERPLPEIFNVDWLVIDEASMLGETEKEMIQQRITEKGSPIKILFMGDHSQIPPVGEKPDQDGFAIDLRKEDTKSVQLTKIERTKNIDIADLGMNFRRAVDYYNTTIEETGSSAKSGLPVSNILTKDKMVNSENVLFTANKKSFIEKFIDIFKKDPQNPRNAIIITYNNENHVSVVQVTDFIRKALFGEASQDNLFLPGEPISIKSTITAKNETGADIELGTNERVFLKTINAKMKTFKVGGKYSSKNITAPVYEIQAIDKNGNLVKFDSLDKTITSQFTSANYDKVAKGYRMSDGSIFKYQDKKSLEQLGLTDIYHSYMVSSHKVQGQTYNFSFVAESNIRKYVNVPSGNGNVILTPKSYAQIVYTAVSRAREKVYILSDAVSELQGNFVEPIITPKPLKSISTIPVVDININNDYDLTNQCN